MRDHALWDLLHRIVKDHEELPAIAYRQSGSTVQISYEKLLGDLEAGACKASVLPESRIGIWGTSSYAWIVAAYACMLGGKHVILLDSTITREDLRFLVGYADVEALAVSEDMILEAGEIFPDLPLYSFEEFQGGKGEEMPSDPEQDIILFTSGTSASSKGVVIPVQTLAKHLIEQKYALPGNPEESYFVPVPLFHLFGFLMVAEVINRNGVFCLSSGVRYLKDDLWAYRAQNVTIVPTMIKFILETSSFPPETRAVITGGSICPQEYQDMLHEKEITLYGMYGMSETLGIVGVSSSEDKGILQYRVVEGVQVDLSDAGEVLVTLPCHFKEYYKKEAETREVLIGDTVMTGDLGELDSSGHLRILGRLGDVIVLRNGEKLNAADLDRDLSSLPGIREAAAFGFDGWPVLAFTPGEDFDEEKLKKALTEYNRGRPVDRRISRVWNYGDSLPVTTTGKIRRGVLAEEYGKREV